MSLLDDMKRHEGFSGVPYECSAGALTIGYGHNLDAKPLTQAQAERILLDDIADAERELEEAFPWMERLPGPAQDVLINMSFNLGIGRLKGFKNFLAALQFGDYQKASEEMLDSMWAKQVGRRAHELARTIRGLVDGPDNRRA